MQKKLFASLSYFVKMVFNSNEKAPHGEDFFTPTCRYNYTISHVYQLKQ